MTTSVVPRLSGKVVEHPTQFRAKQGRQDINVLTVIRNISSLGSSLLVRCKSSPPVIAATARRDVDCNDFFLRAPHMHAHVSKGVLNRTTLPKPGEKVVPKKVIPVSPSGCKTNKNSTVSSTLSLEEL